MNTHYDKCPIPGTHCAFPERTRKRVVTPSNSKKVKNATLSVVLNLAGMIGAFAGVNFTMDFLRGFLPMMNR